MSDLYLIDYNYNNFNTPENFYTYNSNFNPFNPDFNLYLNNLNSISISFIPNAYFYSFLFSSFVYPLNFLFYSLFNFYHFGVYNFLTYNISYFVLQNIQNNLTDYLWIHTLNKEFNIKIIPYITPLVENYNSVEFSKNNFVFNKKIIPNKKLLKIKLLISKEDFDIIYPYLFYSDILAFYNQDYQFLIAIVKKNINIKEQFIRDNNIKHLLEITGYEWTIIN